METRRLFDEDAYVKDFQATVISIEPQSEASFVYDIVLDQTAFFPEEGGQSADTGRLGAGQVQDVQIKDGVITHQVMFDDGEMDLPKVGDMIAGSIQWDRRYTNMQNHTGEHIFSGIVHSKYGFENVGFHLSDNIVTMDYNCVLTEEDVRFVETQANAAIYENIEVRCEYPDRENLAQLDYRSKKELSGAIRIVTIPGVDVCACCAPHVNRTGEVGMLKVIGFQKYKGGTRLEIRCGWRAVQHYRDMLEQLQGISQQVSAAIPQIP
ncbi:MAG: alanyl-tRNA editing protein, partial [Lachnospiraceae bacterium]|nr:alanyl-tRNA editing protein [Lachnospiraceae bacterium]